ncbi:hypothetical protein SCLCIDRAFT_1218809 [Scleroderma citrinum Foug A]|uniref:Uncharacterized protein n=1 Tax=Scleroderma citrinum Foug A TaxID=1036808 RepID=A0A0C3DPZ5_9AGAM|nr:hypothetical protein SCLCIDRAFT_1218809 [Scleroderma citrinum Foug A]
MSTPSAAFYRLAVPSLATDLKTIVHVAWTTSIIIPRASALVAAVRIVMTAMWAGLDVKIINHVTTDATHAALRHFSSFHHKPRFIRLT